MPRLIAAFCVFAALALPAPRAAAAESLDGCTGVIDTLPATISTAGVWCLDHNLSTSMSTGSAITVAGTSVTIDCNGFRLSGLAAGVGTAARGIYAQNRANTTVRGCTLRGFAFGVFFDGVDGAVVEDNEFIGNTIGAVRLGGAGGVVRRNRALDSGRASTLEGIAYGFIVGGENDIIDNTVDGVEQYHAYGIHVSAARGAAIDGNRVRNLAGVQTRTGIYTLDSTGAFVRGNLVAGPGVTGIACVDGVPIVTDNRVGGFSTNIQVACHRSGNVEQVVE